MMDDLSTFLLQLVNLGVEISEGGPNMYAAFKMALWLRKY